jgi:hypothetical protein
MRRVHATTAQSSPVPANPRAVSEYTSQYIGVRDNLPSPAAGLREVWWRPTVANPFPDPRTWSIAQLSLRGKVNFRTLPTACN